MDHYLGSRGFLDESGRFDPTHNMNRKGGVLGSMTSGADSIFASMGIDPRSLTPLQKIMLLGGAMGAGTGAIAGSPALLGAGGLSMIGGAMPSMGGYGQQRSQQGYGQGGQQGFQPPNSPAYRNEWLHQQELGG